MKRTRKPINSNASRPRKGVARSCVAAAALLSEYEVTRATRMHTPKGSQERFSTRSRGVVMPVDLFTEASRDTAKGFSK
eukprot:1153412-Pleurochrysis_carterae.AAC.2